MPMPEELKKVRQEIDYNFSEFKKILSSRKFKSVYEKLDASDEFLLSRVPKGYESDNPAADFLRLKSHIAFINLADEEVVSRNLVGKSARALEALTPLINFLNEAIRG